MGDRNAGVGRRSDSGGDSRHHFNGNTTLDEEGRLLTTAAEEKGVTPLEPHHTTMALRQLHQNRVGAGLRHGVMAATLADEMALAIVRDPVENLLRH